jgi:predicted ATPase
MLVSAIEAFHDGGWATRIPDFLGAYGKALGLDARIDGGWATRLPDFLGACGKALGLAGRLSEGVGIIDAALALAGKEGERWCAAELLRNKGELLLKEDPSDAAGHAKALFIESRNVAHRQGVLAIELRATTSLARLAYQRGDPDAKVSLAQVYAQFTEGFETTDLREARAILDAARDT